MKICVSRLVIGNRSGWCICQAAHQAVCTYGRARPAHWCAGNNVHPSAIGKQRGGGQDVKAYSVVYSKRGHTQGMLTAASKCAPQTGVCVTTICFSVTIGKNHTFVHTCSHCDVHWTRTARTCCRARHCSLPSALTRTRAAVWRLVNPRSRRDCSKNNLRSMHLPLHRPTSLPRGRQHASPCVAGGAQQPYNQPARGRSASPGRSTNIQPRRTVKANTAMETVTTTEADDLAARVAQVCLFGVCGGGHKHSCKSTRTPHHSTSPSPPPPPPRQLKAENDALRNEITGGLANMSHAEVAAAAQRLAKQEAALAAAINDVAKRNPQPAAPAAPATPATVSSAAMSMWWCTCKRHTHKSNNTQQHPYKQVLLIRQPHPSQLHPCLSPAPHPACPTAPHPNRPPPHPPPKSSSRRTRALARLVGACLAWTSTQKVCPPCVGKYTCSAYHV